MPFSFLYQALKIYCNIAINLREMWMLSFDKIQRNGPANFDKMQDFALLNFDKMRIFSLLNFDKIRVLRPLNFDKYQYAPR